MYYNRLRSSKYGAVKTTIDGITFDSKFEAQRYVELSILEQGGFIHDLKLQQTFELQPKFKDRDGKTIRAITYVADFTYYEDGVLVAEDTKGFETKDFILKKKMFLYKYPDIKFLMTKK